MTNRWMAITLGVSGSLKPLAAVFVLTFLPDGWRYGGLMAAALGAACLAAVGDPVRHWPVVLASFVADAAGTVVFATAAADGTLASPAAAALAAGHAVFLVPFALILRRAVAADRTAEDVVRSAAAMPGRAVLRAYKTQRGENLADLTERTPVLLVFLRHAGCCFCRETLSDLSLVRSEVERAGIRIVLVHLSGHHVMSRLAARYELPGIDLVHDGNRRLYHAYGLRRGRLSRLLGPKAWRRGFLAALSHGIGRAEGDPFQMPGVFLVYAGRILRGYYHRSPADRPDYRAICAAGLRALEGLAWR